MQYMPILTRYGFAEASVLWSQNRKLTWLSKKIVLISEDRNSPNGSAKEKSTGVWSSVLHWKEYWRIVDRLAATQSEVYREDRQEEDADQTTSPREPSDSFVYCFTVKEQAISHHVVLTTSQVMKYIVW